MFASASARIVATLLRSGTAQSNSGRAFADRDASSEAEGIGASSSRRLRKTLAVLALAIAAFAVAAVPASAAVKMTSVNEVSYESAHVTGVVLNPDFPFGTFYTFEYSTNPEANGWTPGPSNIASALSNQPAEGTIIGLNDGTKYFVRLTTSGGSVSPKPNPEFTTLDADPTAVLSTDNASDVAYTTATAKGEIDRPVKSNNVACHFEYISDAAFDENLGNTAPGFQGATPVPCETGNPAETPGTVQATGHVPVEAKLTGLTSDTDYHLRLAASNADNADAKEAAAPFKTLKVDPPSVISVENASKVEYTRAQVEGIVERPDTVPDPGVDVNCRFEYVTQAQFEEEGFAAAEPFGQIVGCETEPPENPIQAVGQTTVKGALGNLVPQTTYHLRLSASNQGGSDAKEASVTFTTQGPAPAPSVLTIDDASDIHIHSAHVSGSVERPAGADAGLDVNCRFEYVTQAQFEAEGFAEAEPFGQVVGCEPENPITSPAPGHPAVIVNVEATLALAAGTTYHLRLSASNVGGTDAKEAATFTTRIPVLTLDPPTMGYTSAEVSGTVNPEGGPIDTRVFIWFFEYSTEPANPDSWVSSGVEFAYGGTSTTPEPTGGTIKGLKPGTTYSFRIRLFDGGDVNVTSPQPYPEATTKPVATPTATLDPVTNITANSAHFSGTVDANAPGGLDALGEAAYETKWHIECIPACDRILPAGSGSGVVKAGEGAKAISVNASELDPNQQYQVKLVATNAGGSSAPERTFDTPLVKPAVKQLEGASDGERGYTLQGLVNPNNSKVTDCKFLWGPSSASAEYAFEADCSPMPEEQAKPVTVEAHLTGLNLGARYHALLVATNAAGETKGVDQEFVPTEDQPQVCPNEALRKENSSEALPECRAYEQVTPTIKDGLNTALGASSDVGTVGFSSQAGNIANSGGGFLEKVAYVSARSDTGWEVLANLNGPMRSILAEPENFVDTWNITPYSADLRSSIWFGQRKGETETGIFLRKPDGSFSLIVGSGGSGDNYSATALPGHFGGASNDLSHAVFFNRASSQIYPAIWEPDPGIGVYDVTFTGPDAGQRSRADVDNAASVISTCLGSANGGAARGISEDGRVIFINSFGGCGGSNPPVNEVWARVGGTTSYKASASQCTRTAADPGGACNAVADAAFAGAATADGSRVFFTTTQQMVNGDTDQTKDLYACDIPLGTPAPVGDANSCSALRQVSAGDPSGAGFESFLATSKDGSTVLFTAKGVLADNEDAFKEKAIAGDHNLYLWRTDATHPDGQTTFLARLESDDLGIEVSYPPRITPDGRYLVFKTTNQLVPTDTDHSGDIYRYDAVTGEMIRVSTGITGTGGNAEGFDVGVRMEVTDDGSGIVFETAEPLSPLDGNGGPDVYFWREGQKGARIGDRGSNPQIDASGQNIYFQTATQLSPTDADSLVDVYSAHVLGGFSFPEPKVCSGEACQGPAPVPPGAKAAETEKPGAGNVVPQLKCAKGKVRRHGKCVKKAAKKPHRKKATHKRGGGK